MKLYQCDGIWDQYTSPDHRICITQLNPQLQQGLWVQTLGHGSGNYSVTDSHLRETKKQAQDSDGRYTALQLVFHPPPIPKCCNLQLPSQACTTTSAIISHTITSSLFPTDAIFDATYNRTPLEPKPWFPVDKPNPTLYNCL